ncbi:MAG: CDP-alcohol phosphatidyltransferase family protein [Parachlamydiales bacterium]
MSIFTFSNILSLLRLPLAILFIIPSTSLRLTLLAVSAATDYLDGYIARRSGTVTKLGAMLDPIMDKFFVVFVLSTLVYQDSLQLWQLFSIIARDLFLVVFGVIMLTRKRPHDWVFRSMFWGKLITLLQYAFLFCFVLSLPIPNWVYYAFIGLGVIYFAELLIHELRKKPS